MYAKNTLEYVYFSETLINKIPRNKYVRALPERKLLAAIHFIYHAACVEDRVDIPSPGERWTRRYIIFCVASQYRSNRGCPVELLKQVPWSW